jgi:uncharacterized protein
MKKTLVIGASDNPERYSNKAIATLLAYGVDVLAIGNKQTTAYDIEIHNTFIKKEDIHTVTLYISAKNQQAYIPYILQEVKPQRIIFNPGTENEPFMQQAIDVGIEAIEACTLVMLKTGQY